MNKYRNKKTPVGDILFDSAKEANRYIELTHLQNAGIISNLELQPKFLLQDKFIDNEGNKHRAIYYIADFRYLENDKIIVEDVKGKKTDIYKLKKKLFLKKYSKYLFRET